MNRFFTTVLISVSAGIGIAHNALAQDTGTKANPALGTTTSGIVSTNSHAIVVGWSTRRGLLRKPIFNENGQEVGSVVDLIVTRDTNTPYLIVGAGGFVGFGRHDVAAPISEIQEQGKRLVWKGATRETVKSMSHIAYAKKMALRDEYIADVEADLKKARSLIAETQTKAAAATGEAKAKLDQQLAELKQALKATEEKLAAMKRAAEHRWKEFEFDVSNALATLRQAIEHVTG